MLRPVLLRRETVSWGNMRSCVTTADGTAAHGSCKVAGAQRQPLPVAEHRHAPDRISAAATGSVIPNIACHHIW